MGMVLFPNVRSVVRVRYGQRHHVVRVVSLSFCQALAVHRLYGESARYMAYHAGFTEPGMTAEEAAASVAMVAGELGACACPRSGLGQIWDRWEATKEEVGQ